MPTESAGLLLFRRLPPAPELFLVHPGGPFWGKKDLGAWSIPKGEPRPGEDLLVAAQREFREETGFPPGPPTRHPSVPPLHENLDPVSPFYRLGTVQQAGGKRVTAFALEADCDPTHLESNLCTIEWPLRSGRHLSIPEVDRGAWFDLPEAARRILKGQRPFLNRLATLLDATPPPELP